MLAADGKCLFLIGLEHLQALWAQNSLLERRMVHIAILDGDITAPTDHPTGGDDNHTIGRTGETMPAAKLITVGFSVSRHMTIRKRILQDDTQGFRACLQMFNQRDIAVGTW